MISKVVVPDEIICVIFPVTCFLLLRHCATVQFCCLFCENTVLHTAKNERFNCILDSRSVTDVFTLYKLPKIVVLKCFHCLKSTSSNCGIEMLSLGQITVC